jgi:hypothetical protein
MAKEKVSPEETSADLGANKEYIEYRVDPVTPIFGTREGTPRAVVGYEGKIVRTTPNRTGIRVEPHRADSLNMQWYNRKLILLEKDDESVDIKTSLYEN